MQPDGPGRVHVESVHLHAAKIDVKGKWHQRNQVTIHLQEEPYQDPKTLVQDACLRNRTKVAERFRHEHADPKEIDTFATKGEEGT